MGQSATGREHQECHRNVGNALTSHTQTDAPARTHTHVRCTIQDKPDLLRKPQQQRKDVENGHTFKKQLDGENRGRGSLGRRLVKTDAD